MDETTESLSPIISEEDFIPLVQEACVDFIQTLAPLSVDGITPGKMYYFQLMLEADKFEVFLDDHAARTNKRWFFFTELVACVRNFAIAGFHLSHLQARYDDYLGKGNTKLKEEFAGKTRETLSYFVDTIRRFGDEIVNEIGGFVAKRQGHKGTAGQRKKAATPKLPYTIALDETDNEEERMISIAQTYRRVYKEFNVRRLNRKIKAKSLPELIPGVVNETLFAQMEATLHAVQSEFDTYIRGSRLEAGSESAGMFRGLAAIPLHLAETMRWLTHFYERHEGEIRKSEVKERIANLVNDDRLFTCITDFGLKFLNIYLTEGNRVSERLLSSFVRPVALKLPTPKPQGFHARPSTYVSLIVQEHGTDVFMVVDNERFDCRSVLDMLQAGGLLADRGEEEVVFEGDQRAIDDIRTLARHNYCEDQDIPSKLSYLRIMRNL